MLTNDFNHEIDEQIKSKYELICDKLSVDESEKSSSWNSYISVRSDHTLDVSNSND